MGNVLARVEMSCDLFHTTVTAHFSPYNDVKKRKAIPRLNYADFSVAMLSHINDLLLKILSEII